MQVPATDQPPSFEDWFRDLVPLARQCAARFRGTGDDPDDLVAEAFARAFNRWSTVSVMPYRDAWLMRVLINRGFDVARRRRRLPTRPARSADEVDEGDQVVTRVAMTSALRALPRRQREAISLRYLADLSEADVSKALGVSPNTVKRHLSRARTALRSQLGPGWEEEN